MNLSDIMAEEMLILYII